VPHGGEPPEPPELPAGAETAPRWPAWYGPAAFFAAIFLSLLVTLPVLWGAGDDPTPAQVQVSTVLQNLCFIAVAIGLATAVRRPQAWHFGLRRTRFWRALGWAATGWLAFFVVAAVYGIAIGGVDEQSTADDVGADEGGLALFTAGLLFIVVAPVGEEFFWRGFFYRSLRSAMGVPWAALLGGAVFGLIHLPAGPEAVPPLAAFGVALCLVYERTGSLYPVIGMHAFNNMLAYAVTTDAGFLNALAIGGPVIAASMLLPLAQSRRHRVA
jgi:membrane protease YdiL (CAAX protease family)